ncbi:MAG: peroxiredoxin [Casimicrobiaceae bacterium]
MKRFSTRYLAFLLLLALPAHAALDLGETAPTFTIPAALGGKVYKFSLAESLKKGPVVLYFFPAAYSSGCSAEAHFFAESLNQFDAFNASVVGVSSDGIESLTKFSVQACQNKFPVASDESMAVIKSFDAVMQTRPEYASRVTYVIAPDGKIVFQYNSLNPAKHVEKTLAALRSWAEANAKK